MRSDHTIGHFWRKNVFLGEVTGNVNPRKGGEKAISLQSIRPQTRQLTVLYSGIRSDLSMSAGGGSGGGHRDLRERLLRLP